MAALRTSLPIMVTFIVLGIGYGILMQKHGYGPVWSLMSGIIIFSGTVQFVSISFLGSGSVVMAAVTALMVSARHIFFSISMIGRYQSEGKRKWYLLYALCDETYAMLSRDDDPEGVNISVYTVSAYVRIESIEELKLSEDEVEEVFLLPTTWLEDNEMIHFDLANTSDDELPPKLRVYLSHYGDYRNTGETDYIEYEGHGIWGLTARIIKKSILHR